jgi:hypothetical protein
MASGHENRASRSNTWLHRPAANVKKTLANGAPSTHGHIEDELLSQHVVPLVGIALGEGLQLLGGVGWIVKLQHVDRIRGSGVGHDASIPGRRIRRRVEDRAASRQQQSDRQR